jgi:hypothetical protein
MILMCGSNGKMQRKYVRVYILSLSTLPFWVLGQSASEDTAAYYSDAETLKGNVIDPILSRRPVVSADGSTFNGQASCQAENEYLRVYARVQMDGDVDVSVVHDHDLDGVFAPVQTISHVAGVCHNGYATNCNHDFSSCDFFEWAVDAALNITGTPSSLAQGGGVEGCYCINNSCGAGLYFVNQERIHDDIGTGISLAFQSTNPSFGITNVVASAGMTSFFGHDPDSCGTTQTSQQVYYAHPSNIPSAAFAASGSSALFASVSSGQSSGHTTTSQTCFEEHGADIVEPSLRDIIDITRLNGVVNVSPCGANCFLITVGQPGDNYLQGGACTQYHHTVEFDVKRPQDISHITLIDVAHDDDSLIQHTIGTTTTNIWVSNLWDPTSPPARCERAHSDYTLINQNMTHLFETAGVFEMDFWGLVGDLGELYVRMQVNITPSCETTPTVHHTCGSIPSDCYLDAEEIDTVQTMVNTVGTGLVPLPSSRTFTRGACSDTLNRPYWRIDRTYQCPAAGNTYDFSAGLDRAVTINNSASPTGYDDKRTVNGTTLLSSHTLTLPALPTVEPCQQSCKTSKEVGELGISTMGLSVGMRPDDTRFEYSYKACDGTTCPLEAGETVVSACGCLDRFSEAASAIQAFRLAGKDFVCTTEPP